MDAKADLKKLYPGVADTIREAVQLGWFKTATIFALADLASRGATAEELNGANRLIEHLELLAADEVKLQRLPVKALEFFDRRQGEDKNVKHEPA